MSQIFDLSRILNLVQKCHPARVLIVDTNVLMNNPDPNSWTVNAEGKSLFVLSDTLVQELEFIRQREVNKPKSDSREKAIVAVKAMTNLFKNGAITDGIAVQNGWVIGVPSPTKRNLDLELDQIEDIVKAFGRSDVKLVLLTKECHQQFTNKSVALITGEWNLFNIVQMQGVPCHLCSTFPIEDLREASAIAHPIDWNQVLEDVQIDTKQKAIEVEVTLLSSKKASSWVGLVSKTENFNIAEGNGTVRIGVSVRSFTWTILFRSRSILEPKQSEEDEGSAALPAIYLDFFGKEDFDQEIFDAIADRLVDCVDISLEEDKPTLQSPKSVIEMLMFVEYLNDENKANALEDLKKEIADSDSMASFWAEWIDVQDESERYATIEWMVEAVTNCWEIGKTYRYSIIVDGQSHE